MHACMHTYIHTYMHTYIGTYVTRYADTHIHSYIDRQRGTQTGRERERQNEWQKSYITWKQKHGKLENDSKEKTINYRNTSLLERSNVYHFAGSLNFCGKVLSVFSPIVMLTMCVTDNICLVQTDNYWLSFKSTPSTSLLARELLLILLFTTSINTCKRLLLITVQWFASHSRHTLLHTTVHLFALHISYINVFTTYNCLCSTSSTHFITV